MIQQQAKYYIPSIEEFHVGFEFEQYYENYPNLNDGWKRVILEKDVRLKCFQGYINEGRVRVKCLDDTDLKELGWKYRAYHEAHDGEIYSKQTYSERDGGEMEVYFFVIKRNICR
jgi:hypothetical protein